MVAWDFVWVQRLFLAKFGCIVPDKNVDSGNILTNKGLDFTLRVSPADSMINQITPEIVHE